MYQQTDHDQEQCRSYHDLTGIHVSASICIFHGSVTRRNASRVSPDLIVACNARYITPMMRVRLLNLQVTRKSLEIQLKKIIPLSFVRA
jgi:hypothetical protein